MNTNRKTGALVALAGAVLAAAGLALRSAAAAVLARWDASWAASAAWHPFGDSPATVLADWAGAAGLLVMLCGIAVLAFPGYFSRRRR